MRNTHRNYISPKIGQRIEFLGKAMRKQYMRDAIYPDSKIYFDVLRDRQPDDHLQKLNDNKEIAAVIKGREEHPELDIVFPNRVPFTVKGTDHGLVRPYMVRYKDEEIMINVLDIKEHIKSRRPVFMECQRYIPGRPNLISLPLNPV